MPDPTWQELYNAAIVEFDLTKLPERVEAPGTSSSVLSRWIAHQRQRPRKGG